MTSAVIKWDDINASTVPIGFKVYRSDTPIDPNGTLPAPLATLTRDIFEYEDTTVVFGNTYYYRVSAYTDTNESFSDEIVATVKQSVYGSYSSSLQKASWGSTEVGFSKYVSGNIKSITADVNGNVYVVNDTGNDVYKLDAYGNVLWSYSFTAAVKDVAIDNAGNVYAGGDDRTLTKLDASGALVWSVNPSNSYNYFVSFAVDAQGFIWCAGTGSTDVGVHLFRVDPNGVLQNNITIDHSGYSKLPHIAVDDSMNCYILYAYDYSTTSRQCTLIKFDPTMTELWRVDLGGTNYYLSYSIAVDPKMQRVYCGTNSNLKAYDFQGNDVSAFTSGYAGASGVAVDNDSNVYIQDSNYRYRKFDSTMADLGTYTFSGQYFSASGGFEVDPGRYYIQNNLVAPTA